MTFRPMASQRAGNDSQSHPFMCQRALLRFGHFDSYPVLACSKAERTPLQISPSSWWLQFLNRLQNSALLSVETPASYTIQKTASPRKNMYVCPCSHQLTCQLHKVPHALRCEDVMRTVFLYCVRSSHCTESVRKRSPLPSSKSTAASSCASRRCESPHYIPCKRTSSRWGELT